MKKTWALAAACFLALSACSGQDAQDAPETEAAATTASHKMGEMVKGNAASIKIEYAYTSDHYEKIAETYPTEQRDKIKARKDGQIVVVKTTVLNQGKDEMDLTCGFGMQVELVSDKDSNYTPVGELYDIPGNPECNDKLGTDFDDEMTWVFEIPKTHKPVKIGFTNPKDHYDQLTYIELDKLGTGPKKSSSESDGPKPTQQSEVPAEESTASSSPVTTNETPPNQAAPAESAASAPSRGAACSASQIGQSGTGPDGAPLVCVGMGGGNPARWVDGPAPSGETVSDGQECVDGDSGGQDSQGRMMMCVGGTWVYGP